MSTLDDFYTAQRLDKIIETKVDSILNKKRPAPRYAVVKEINTDEKYAMVSYIGEDSIVKIPYGSVAPENVGDAVRIEGVPGDRYISDVLGDTKLKILANLAKDTAEDIKTGITSGYDGTDSGDSEVNGVIKDYQDRITKLEGAGLFVAITSSTNINLSNYKSVKVIMIGSSQPATHGASARVGDLGGVPGGFISGEVTTEQLSALGFDLTAFPVVVGTNSGQSYFGPSNNFVIRTIPGRADKGDRMGANATTSGPGKGGNGESGAYGSGDYSVQAVQGSSGVSSVLADGGAVGSGQTNGVGNPGMPGGDAPINGPFPCGGAGGGGGATGVPGFFGITNNGGPGGAGGFPGGGPGGGGTGNGNNVSFGNVGASGPVSNGIIILELT